MKAKIQHVALWVNDLEAVKSFYEKYFFVSSGEKYTNPAKKFSSYLLHFQGGGVLEIMHRPSISAYPDKQLEYTGWAHIAIGVGSREKVIEVTEVLERDGFHVVGRPRVTGDGFFESVVLDPEGNRIEITV